MCPSGATCLLADCCDQNPTKRVGLANLIIISLNINLLSPWYSWTIGGKQQLLIHSLYIWKKTFIIRIVEYSTGKYIHGFYVTMVVIYKYIRTMQSRVAGIKPYLNNTCIVFHLNWIGTCFTVAEWFIFNFLTFLFFSDRTETAPSSANPITSVMYDYIREDTHDERNRGKNYRILLHLHSIFYICILLKNHKM